MGKAAKSAGKAPEKSGGLLSGIPLGAAMDVVDGVGGFLFRLFMDRYRVEERIEQVKEDARTKAEELKAEAIKTGYAVKKAFFRAVVEAVLLTTGMLALIVGIIMVVSDVVPLKFVLLGYGVLVTAYIALKLKTQP
jgi:hypothetical protein